MKTSLRSLLAVACMAMASAAVTVWAAVRTGFAYAMDFLRDINPLLLKKPNPTCHPALVQAKAFVMRLAKRDRPTVMARWRMCPST